MPPVPVYIHMETARKTTKKRSSGPAPDKIIAAYKEYLLTQGARPASVYKFCLDLGIREEEFYAHYGSFEGLDRSIWKQFIEQTVSTLENDKAFPEFSAREKVLALYYTLLEVLKANRSFALLQLNENKNPAVVPGFLKDFKARFEDTVSQILNEAQKNGEVAVRPYLDKRYPKFFWLHLGLLLTYWKNDDSAGFEHTDAYVEKSVRLAFDMMGKGVLDSAIDFAKFIYQSKVK